MRVRLFHEAKRGVQRLVRARLIRAEGHVRNDEGALYSTGDGARQRDEVVDGHRQSRVVAENVVTGRVADEQKVDASRVEDGCSQLVIAGQPGELQPTLFRVLKVSGTNAFVRRFSCHG